MPTWLKALFAAALSGFAGAALDALTKSIAGGAPDYKGALHAGIAAAVVGVLAYLKASPLNPPPDSGGGTGFGSSRYAALPLIGVLLVGSLTQSACGNATTLNRIGAGFVQAAAGIKAEVASLNAAGLLSPEKFARLDKRATGIQTAANALKSYLDSLPGVTAGNKAEVIGKIAEATSLVSALLQNSDLANLPPDNVLIKVLLFANVTLQNAAIVVAGVHPPPASNASFALDPGAAVPLHTITVQVGKPPKGAEKYFK